MPKGRYEGTSTDGFKAAVDDAWEKAKAEDGKSKKAKGTGGPARLRVAEMYVTASNPIHDYIVVLEPEGP
jgi:hypothetical protein